MDEYTVEQLKEAARRALADKNDAAAKRFIDAARQREAEQAAEAARMADAPIGEQAMEAGKSLAAGGIRGAAETTEFFGKAPELLANLPTNFVLRMMGQEPMAPLPQGETMPEAASRLTGGFSEYRSPTTLGQYAGTVGEFAGGAAVMPMGAGIPRAIGMSVVPALASETAGQIAQRVSPENENMARLLGAIAAPAGLEGLKAGARRMLTGPEARMMREGSERAASAGLLERAGVPMTAGQKIGSERLMRLEGVEATDLSTVEGVTKTAMRMLGSDAPRATPKALAERKQSLGAVFDRAEEVVNEVPTAADVQAALSIKQNFEDISSDPNMPRVVQEALDRITESAQTGTPISGATIAEFRTRLGKAVQSSKGDERAVAAMAMSEALDNILERGVSRVDPDLYNVLRDTRGKYRDYLTVLRAQNRSGSEARSGLITPNALGTAARLREGTKYITGEGRSPLGDLAFAAEEVVASLPAVGAGGARFDPRLVAGMLGLGGAGAGMMGGDLLAAGLLGAAGVAAPAAGRAVLRSGPVQRGLMPPTAPMEARLLQRLAQQSGGLLNIGD
jgi:hypothetical protein